VLLAVAWEEDKSQWQIELEEGELEAKRLRDDLAAAEARAIAHDNESKMAEAWREVEEAPSKEREAGVDLAWRLRVSPRGSMSPLRLPPPL
jgi:hypothetical protein